MSQSPANIKDGVAVDSYTAAWLAIRESARSGNSWSGSEANRTFLNTGDGRFADASYVLGYGMEDDGRALAVSDWDGDGDLDLWAHNRSAPRLRLMRNNTPPQSGAIAFRLTGGKKSNRDAIGARLKLVLSDGSELIQTSRAGSGFLSQSSKWIHFGYGKTATPASLQVDWPDGSKESFENLAANARYRIEQGRPAKQVAARKLKLGEPRRERQVTTHPATQMVLPGKIPLPEFRFTPAGDALSTELKPDAKPMLIVLFSGTCQSCGEELREFARHERLLRDSNLDVLALSVDGLASRPNQFAADKLIADSGFPFATGKIAPSSADHLRFLLKSLYDYPAPFSVPLSLLLDEQRRLFAVYRGRVSPQLVLHDAAFSMASAEQLRDLAVPFRGRWFTSPISPSELAEMVAAPFHDAFPEQGLRYLEYAAASATSTDQKIRLLRRVSGGYYKLAWQQDSSGSKSKALGYYEKTLALDPSNFKARIDFGALLGNQGDLEAAEAQFRKALELSPGNEVASKNLELLQQRRR